QSKQARAAAARAVGGMTARSLSAIHWARRVPGCDVDISERTMNPTAHLPSRPRRSCGGRPVALPPWWLEHSKTSQQESLRMRSRAHAVWVASFLLGLALPAWAQLAPLGGEFVVNDSTTGGQLDAAVASDGSGRFVVVWTSIYGTSGSD